VFFHTKSKLRGNKKLENTPEIEKTNTELTAKEQILKLKSELSESEIAEVFTIKTEKTETPKVEVPETKAPTVESSVKLSPEIEMVAHTLMASAEEKVKSIYKDFDYSGIKNDPSLNALEKVTLMSTVAEPNAKRMATIEKNLKTENSTEGTEKTETKKAEFSAPEKSGKVDEEAGKKLLTEMSEKLGLHFDEEESK
jgi:hypothetical protein